MEKIKILVSYHKPCVYTPIHVGCQITPLTDEMPTMLGDDSGDHISWKNTTYSEMTAQYWAWKNIHDVEYIGFCHYRRYFDIKLSYDNVDEILKKNDVLLVNDRGIIPIILGC